MAEYIERDALLAEFKRLGLGEHGLIERVFADGVYVVIAGMPAADVAPVVHGRWAPVDEVPPCGEWRCTACGDTRTFVWDMSTDDMRGCYAYCPNCGARMDGDSDETN